MLIYAKIPLKGPRWYVCGAVYIIYRGKIYAGYVELLLLARWVRSFVSPPVLILADLQFLGNFNNLITRRE